MAGAAGRGRVAEGVAPGEARGSCMGNSMPFTWMANSSAPCPISAAAFFEPCPNSLAKSPSAKAMRRTSSMFTSVIAHAHLEAVGIGDGQKPLLVALIGKGDGGADGDAVHAVAVAELVGLGDAGEGVDPLQGPEGARGPRIPAPRRRRRWHSVPALTRTVRAQMIGQRWQPERLTWMVSAMVDAVDLRGDLRRPRAAPVVEARDYRGGRHCRCCPVCRTGRRP